MTSAPLNRRALALAAAFAFLGAGRVPAADYPERPLRLIVPYPAGGPNDTLARLVGHKISESWGKQTIIENRPGAGGNLAVEAAARAPADGYTAVLPAMAYAVNPALYAKVPYDFREMRPVSLVAKGPLVLVVHPSLPVRSVAELVALAKQKPGGLDYASSGNGSSLHLAAELFKLEAGVDLVHVPYKGSNDLLADLLTGRVPIAFLSPINASEYVKDGRLRALGVTSAERAPAWPDVPSIAEAGVPRYQIEGWYAILVPAATPDEAVRRLNRSIGEALAAPDVKDRLGALGIQAVASTPEEAAAYIDAEAKKWDGVVRTAKIRAD